MLINDSPSLTTYEEVHFQDLPLVLLPDAPNEGEVIEHASFRVALDGFTNWSSVSRNPFLFVSTDSFPMAHAFVLVPLSVDNTDEIPLAELVRKKSRRRLKTFKIQCQTRCLNLLHPHISFPFPLLGSLKLDKNVVKLRIGVASTSLHSLHDLNPPPKPRNPPFLWLFPNLHPKSTILSNPRRNPKRNKLLPLFLLPVPCQISRLKIEPNPFPLSCHLSLIESFTSVNNPFLGVGWSLDLDALRWQCF
ncbi:hypothetical protein MTR67_031515 [Solanum verrucosum]|uniref:Uncharacterized protein n=1 Tax=Solanum verrucosum TaxID=315347 RepID=A0AAF0U2L2_SOLVR|nr:hypothetical protein MTR67_031515 [Solanum verrucosum]